MTTPEEMIAEILLKHDIRMSIGGCGCCGSPWVSFEYKGKLLVKDRDDFHINMLEENTNG